MLKIKYDKLCGVIYHSSQNIHVMERVKLRLYADIFDDLQNELKVKTRERLEKVNWMRV